MNTSRHDLDAAMRIVHDELRADFPEINQLMISLGSETPARSFPIVALLYFRVGPREWRTEVKSVGNEGPVEFLLGRARAEFRKELKATFPPVNTGRVCAALERTTSRLERMFPHVGKMRLVLPTKGPRRWLELRFRYLQKDFLFEMAIPATLDFEQVPYYAEDRGYSAFAERLRNINSAVKNYYSLPHQGALRSKAWYSKVWTTAENAAMSFKGRPWVRRLLAFEEALRVVIGDGYVRKVRASGYDPEHQGKTGRNDPRIRIDFDGVEYLTVLDCHYPRADVMADILRDIYEFVTNTLPGLQAAKRAEKETGVKPSEKTLEPEEKTVPLFLFQAPSFNDKMPPPKVSDEVTRDAFEMHIQQVVLDLNRFLAAGHRLIDFLGAHPRLEIPADTQFFRFFNQAKVDLPRELDRLAAPVPRKPAYDEKKENTLVGEVFALTGDNRYEKVKELLAHMGTRPK